MRPPPAPHGPAMSALAEPPTLEPPPSAAPPVRREAPRPGRRPTAAVPVAPAPAVLPADGRLTLGGATWEVYVALADAPANADLKFTFDGPNGLLEIEMPNGFRHESVSRLLCLLVAAFAEERELDYAPAGSLSLRREDRGRGADSDESFYVSNYDRRPAPGTNVPDLAAGDAPPDLVIEVDVTSPGTSKLPIYAALGVAEVWVWADDGLTARHLANNGEYERVSESAELPGFPLSAAAELIARRGELSAGRLVAAFRETLRAARGGA